MENRWVSPVQYSPRRQSRWVLANYGGNGVDNEERCPYQQPVF